VAALHEVVNRGHLEQTNLVCLLELTVISNMVYHTSVVKKLPQPLARMLVPIWAQVANLVLLTASRYLLHACHLVIRRCAML
jgi:hypothetical protein